MKYRVGVNGKVYQVEIISVENFPIRAIIDDQVFEVWPVDDNNEKNDKNKDSILVAEKKKTSSNNSSEGFGSRNNENRILRAPLPGIVLSISVKEGDLIEIGQELCIIEAMKMKNVIKATYAGKIIKIQISSGQHVRHKDILFKFE